MNYENLTKETLPVEFQNRIERFNRLFSAATDHSFEEDDLFEYEMLCIKQALSFSEFFQDFGDEQYQDFLKQYESLYDLVDAIKDKLQFFDNGHTGNSMSMSWLYSELIEKDRNQFRICTDAWLSSLGMKAIMMTVQMFQNYERNTTGLLS